LAIAATDEGRGRSIAALLSPKHPTGAHVEACLTRLRDSQIDGALKLRHGDTIEQIAAEAYGDFVQRMIAALNALPDAQSNIFIARPVAPHRS